MLKEIVFPVLFFLCGAFAAFCAIKDYPWFMGHRRAKKGGRLLGHNGTRIFYVTLGLALMAVAAVVFMKGGFGAIDQ